MVVPGMFRVAAAKISNRQSTEHGGVTLYIMRS